MLSDLHKFQTFFFPKLHVWWSICKLESPSSDIVIRMEQYIPYTPAYVSWNPLLVILWSEWNSTYLTHVLLHSDHSITRRGFQLTYAGVSGMCCSILITVLQEEDSNLHTAHTWYPCICKLESSSCDTVIRMEQYIPDTPAYVSWNPLLVILWFWSQYHKKRIPTYICRCVRYVLFHSDHNITRREFQFTYAVVSGMYRSILIRMEQNIPDTPAYVI
jgi:hypothetical protein